CDWGIRDYMLGFDAPFNPLREKGASGRGRKERKNELQDDSDGPGGDGAGLEAMQELLGGLSRLPQGGVSSNAAGVDLESHREWLPH
ncbi:hypothetical protein HAX54_022339, partial [Datura stramonium]|nr:hypothetical protein [Datura stramonium]